MPQLFLLNTFPVDLELLNDKTVFFGDGFKCPVQPACEHPFLCHFKLKR